jgi:predicted  nucleic acid-binding Zn-ribbon protein
MRDDHGKLTDAERTNQEIMEHLKRTRELIAAERRDLERIRNSIADTREHIELTQRFLRRDS